MVLEILATLCAGIFAGAALYISAVEHPARLACGTALALQEFGPSYRRATVMQVPLAVIGFVAAVGAWWRAATVGFLLGGLLLGAVVPFTLLVILPTNRRLLAPSLDPESAEAATLLMRWGRLHAIRSLSGMVAFGVFVLSLAEVS